MPRKQRFRPSRKPPSQSQPNADEVIGTSSAEAAPSPGQEDDALDRSQGADRGQT